MLHQKTLIQIAVHLPDALPELKRIKGIGDRLLERYGEELITMIGAYRKEKNIETVVLPSPAPETPTPVKPKTPKIDTKQASLDLFEKGRSLAQIAEDRGLVRSTIEGHMAHWVVKGKVAIDALVEADKRERIQKEFMRGQGASFNTVKQALGNEVSYGEIKLVRAHLDYRDSER